jgi:hypothetical protein
MDMNLQWRKATYSSSNGGNCIEVATADRTVAVRDSKNPDGPRLTFKARAWQTFAAKIKGKRCLPIPLDIRTPHKGAPELGSALRFRPPSGTAVSGSCSLSGPRRTSATSASSSATR